MLRKFGEGQILNSKKSAAKWTEEDEQELQDEIAADGDDAAKD